MARKGEGNNRMEGRSQNTVRMGPMSFRTRTHRLSDLVCWVEVAWGANFSMIRPQQPLSCVIGRRGVFSKTCLPGECIAASCNGTCHHSAPSLNTGTFSAVGAELATDREGPWLPDDTCMGDRERLRVRGDAAAAATGMGVAGAVLSANGCVATPTAPTSSSLS